MAKCEYCNDTGMREVIPEQGHPDPVTVNCESCVKGLKWEVYRQRRQLLGHIPYNEAGPPPKAVVEISKHPSHREELR